LEEAVQRAQAQAQAQRDSVAQVQQALGVLAAEQRNVSEQNRQLAARRERLVADRAGLVATDELRLQQLGQEFDLARESADIAHAQLEELQALVPTLDEARSTQQQQVNTEAARQADVSARLDALKALQERVKTDGKLQPWLSKHGLDHLQGLWSRIQVEAGWENAVEAALRDRLGALEVSRLDMVQAFGADAPPAKLSFFSAPDAGAAPAKSALPRLADLVRVNDAGLAAVVQSWLAGCFTASSLEAALARRG
jgi:chromosome segregation protein